MPTQEQRQKGRELCETLKRGDAVAWPGGMRGESLVGLVERVFEPVEHQYVPNEVRRRISLRLLGWETGCWDDQVIAVFPCEKAGP